MTKENATVGGFLSMIFKPLLNQRGEVGDTPDPAAADPNAAEGDPGVIPGTTFKTQDELVKSYTELQAKLGSQGSELGQVRKDHAALKGQAETLAQILKENLAKGKVEPEQKGVDYTGQLKEVKTQLEGLDPMAADFSKTQAKLISKLTNIVAMDQHEKTLKAATDSASSLLKKELGDRDAKASQEKFYQQNPGFKTPEMQAKIKDFMANDATGMHDPMSAFFQIQRDEVSAQFKTVSDQNVEMQKRLDLAKGTDSTGKVIVKGQSPGQQQTKIPIPTGKDVDIGMKAALDRLRTT